MCVVLGAGGWGSKVGEVWALPSSQGPHSLEHCKVVLSLLNAVDPPSHLVRLLAPFSKCVLELLYRCHRITKETGSTGSYQNTKKTKSVIQW